MDAATETAIKGGVRHRQSTPWRPVVAGARQPGRPRHRRHGQHVRPDELAAPACGGQDRHRPDQRPAHAGRLPPGPSPVDADGVSALLQELAMAAGQSLDLVAVDIPMSSPPPAEPATPAGMTPAPAPQDPLPGEVVDQDEEGHQSRGSRWRRPRRRWHRRPMSRRPEPAAIPEPVPAPVVEETPSTLLGWLTSPRLAGPARASAAAMSVADRCRCPHLPRPGAPQATGRPLRWHGRGSGPAAGG